MFYDRKDYDDIEQLVQLVKIGDTVVNLDGDEMVFIIRLKGKNTTVDIDFISCNGAVTIV